MTKRYFKSDMNLLRSVVIAVSLSPLLLAGCTTGEVMNQGYVVDQETLALAPVGSSREQVLLSLGSPSTTATFDNEVFYYISQKRQRSMEFMKPKLVEQSILTVYFDKDGNVAKLANYTLQDGRVFDMISRTTPTGGVEMSFLGQLLKGGTSSGSMARSILGSNGVNN